MALSKKQKSKIESCVKSRKKKAGRKNPKSADYAICTSAIKGKKK